MIRVESETLLTQKLTQVRAQVRKMEEQSYSKMAIMYFLSQNYDTVSGRQENENFVIKLS